MILEDTRGGIIANSFIERKCYECRNVIPHSPLCPQGLNNEEILHDSDQYIFFSRTRAAGNT